MRGAREEGESTKPLPILCKGVVVGLHGLGNVLFASRVVVFLFQAAVEVFAGLTTKRGQHIFQSDFEGFQTPATPATIRYFGPPCFAVAVVVGKTGAHAPGFQAVRDAAGVADVLSVGAVRGCDAVQFTIGPPTVSGLRKLLEVQALEVEAGPVALAAETGIVDVDLCEADILKKGLEFGYQAFGVEGVQAQPPIAGLRFGGFA